MHEVTVILFDCKPLKAKLSKGACAKTHDYEQCRICSGVTGRGKATTVTATGPRPERVAVMTIDGRYGYV